jgi:hypothetical protein
MVTVTMAVMHLLLIIKLRAGIQNYLLEIKYAILRVSFSALSQFAPILSSFFFPFLLSFAKLDPILLLSLSCSTVT